MGIDNPHVLYNTCPNKKLYIKFTNQPKMSTIAFSIIIPTWNNLPFLKICIASIIKNSIASHQIIVHINDGSDGTLEWIKEQGIDYTYSKENIGVCMSCNMMRSKVKNNYIFYLNDDMYLLPGWDISLTDEINKLPDNKFFLSGTMIQPHNSLDVGILCNYGDTPETFDEKRLLAEYKLQHIEDWHGATWPPNLVHRDIWDLVGGYSIEYTPGMYSDPDFTAKLWMAGIRHFKGLGDCRVYHFETRSTSRIRKNDGNVQFLMKWGINNSTLRKTLTHLGTPANKMLTQPNKKDMKHKRVLGRIKAIVSLLIGKQFGPINHLE